MNSSSNHTSSLQISQNPLFFQHRSLGRKIMRKVFHPLKLSSSFELTLIFIQCFQLFFQLLLHTYSLDNTLDFSSELLLRPILFFAQIICPGWLLDFTTRTELSLAIVAFMVILCLMKLGLILYAVVYATEHVPRKKTLISLVNWEVKTLIPVTFFMTLSIFSRMIWLACQDEIKETGLSNLACIIGFTFLVILRSGIVIALIHFLTYLLPNRSLLAVNNDSMDLMIVLHQIALLTLQFLPSGQNFKLSLWTLALTSLFFCFIELYLHFQRLVSQNIKGLYFKGYLLGLVTLLNTLLVIRVFVISVSPESRFGVDTTLILFGVLSPIVLKLVSSFLNGALLKIMKTTNDVDPQRMLYKISIINHAFRTKKDSSRNSQSNDLENLLYTACSINVDKIFGIVEPLKGDMHLKENKNLIITRYLEVLCGKFPKSDLVKLHAAYYHGRKLKNYEPAIKLLAKIENTDIQNISVSACLLKRDFEALLQMRDDVSNSNQIDLKTYLNSKIAFSRLQVEVFKQIDLQVQVYQGYVQNQVNVLSICDASLKVVLQRKRLKRMISQLLPAFPEGYIEPYFFLKGYYLTANHSLGGYYQYSKIIQERTQKIQKNIESLHINPDNLYDPQNVFLVISGQKESIGQIHYCSKSALKMLGWDPHSLNGKNLSTIVPPILHKFYADIIATFSEERTKNVTDQTFQAFVRHRAGHIIQVDVSFAVHPLFHRGFFLDVVIRPLLQKKDHIIFTQDGIVAGFTQKIGRKLGLINDSQRKGLTQINQISQRLGDVNNALNLTKRKDPTQVEKVSVKAPISSQPSAKGLINSPRIEADLNTGESVFLKPRSNSSSSEERVGTNLSGYHWKIEEWNYSATEVRICVLEQDETKGPLMSSCSDLREFVKNDEENFDLISENEALNVKSPKISNYPHPILHANLLTSPRSRRSHDKPAEFFDFKPLDTGSQSLGSLFSQRSQYKRMSKAYENALQTRYYPKYISNASRLIGGIFLVILALQIDLQIHTSHNLTEIKKKKDMIEVAELRNNYLIELANSVRSQVQSSTPFNCPNDFQPEVPILEIITQRTALLEQANENLLEATSSLRQDTDKARLFDRDVKIYDLENNGDYIMVTHFQAVNLISQSIDHALSEVKENRTAEAQEELQSVQKNSLNDLLEACEEAVDVFLGSLKSLENDTNIILHTRSLPCIMMLVVVLGIGASLAAAQYVKMKSNITAFGNLDSGNVKKILTNLVEFRQSVEDGTFLDKEKSDQLNDQENSLLLGPKKSLAKKTRRVITYHAIAKKYALYGIKLAVFIGLLAALFSGYQILMHQRINKIDTKLSQVYYSVWISSQINLCYNSLLTLFSPDNNPTIRNQPAYDQATQSLAQITGIISSLTDGYFADQDRTSYDPDVFQLLFKDGCSMVPENTTASTLCSTALLNGGYVNFVSAVVKFESIANQLFEKFKESNKMIPALIDLSCQTNSDLLEPLTIFKALNQILSVRLNFLFEESIEGWIHYSTQMGIWIDFIIVFSAGLMWLLVVKKIREVDNEFKNVLSVFPANVVLSNFKLKNYLKETSHEIFHFFK